MAILIFGNIQKLTTTFVYLCKKPVLEQVFSTHFGHFFDIIVLSVVYYWDFIKLR